MEGAPSLRPSFAGKRGGGSASGGGWVLCLVRKGGWGISPPESETSLVRIKNPAAPTKPAADVASSALLRAARGCWPVSLPREKAPTAPPPQPAGEAAGRVLRRAAPLPTLPPPTGRLWRPSRETKTEGPPVGFFPPLPAHSWIMHATS